MNAIQILHRQLTDVRNVIREQSEAIDRQERALTSMRSERKRLEDLRDNYEAALAKLQA